MELLDGHGQILKPYSTPGFHNGWSWTPNPGLQQPVINLYFAPALKTTNPLTLRGKVSVDDAWPIPFSLRLPPR